MGTARYKGFTLLEVLIAVAIFAVISMISYSTLSQYLIVRERLDENYQAVQRLQRSFTLLERDLRYISDRPVRDELGENEQAFMFENEYGLSGEILRLTTVLPDTANPGLSNLERVAWRLEDGELYRNVWQVLDREQDSEAKEYRVMSDIDSVEVILYSWSDELGLQQVDGNTLNGDVPFGIELLITMDDASTFRRVFDLANGQ